MNIKGSTVAVIGGAGFIGSSLVDELLKEDVDRVIVYDNFTRGKKGNLKSAIKDNRVKVIEGNIIHIDVLNDALKNVDFVFHLAALWLLHCYEYPRAAFEVNIKGTFNVIEACVKHKVKKLVYSSSASVYGNALEIPMTENHPYNNRTFYGATKIAGEHMCRAFNERYGLNYVGLRYMNVYGPRQDYRGAYTTVIMKILDRLNQNQPPIVYGDGSQSYDFIYVTDAARANICALKSDVTDDFFNVGMGTRISIKELTQILLELTRSNLPIKFEPSGQTFVTHRIGSIEKAKEKIGFKAEIELNEGLKKLIEWRNRQPNTGVL
ncbi:UDP-N-acetylglucosamine 4-epimerase [subsurface metagenome]